jgi:pimeloyl-ACP methyl ester carboxylesterase
MDLHYREYGDRAARPVLLLHGLLGSSANWGVVARRLGAGYRVITPDLRNHGRSPHDDEMTYPAMARDVLGLMDGLGLESAVLVGHSMGGKVAMWCALQAGERVAGLMPVDIAPVAYPNRFGTVLRAMEAVDLAALEHRRDADRILARHLDDPALRGYLLQNLVHGHGGWRWRLNLDAIRRCIRTLLDFPAAQPGQQYTGPVRFVYGADSGYVSADALGAVHGLFPYARLRGVAGAGHWVYAERPDEFVRALESFLAGT